MALYARIWKVAAGLIGAGGLVLALLTEPVSVVLGPLAAAGAIALTLALGMSIGTGSQSAPVRFLPVFGVAFCVVGTLAFLVVGVFSLVAIAALVAATSPYALVRVCGLGAAEPTGSLRVGAADSRVFAELSITDLGLQWRHTSRLLIEARDAAAKARIVRVRAALLDELERRDSDGIQVWLESGYSAEGDPTQYMQRAGERDDRGEGGARAA